MDRRHFDEIKRKYGRWASWAIWNEKDVRDIDIINQRVSNLRTDVVMAALNISKEIKLSFGNFHRTKNDSKLSYAINNSKYRGAYITDVIKGYKEGNSFRVKKDLNLKKELKHMKYFKRELIDLGGDIKLIIAIGQMAHDILKRHIGGKYPILRITHYSYRFNNCHDPLFYAKRVRNELEQNSTV